MRTFIFGRKKTGVIGSKYFGVVIPFHDNKSRMEFIKNNLEKSGTNRGIRISEVSHFGKWEINTFILPKKEYTKLITKLQDYSILNELGEWF
jgi:hypothetical protein